MSKSVKFKNDTYLDSTSIVHKKQKLNEIIDTNILTELEVATNELVGRKRVYKKMFTGNIQNSTDAQTLFTFSDINYVDIWLDESLSEIYKDSESLTCNWCLYENNNFVYSRVWINKEEKKFRLKTSTNLEKYKYKIILAYTKNTV